MKPTLSASKTIEEYLAAFPPEQQARLNQVADSIRAAAPGAQERISYGMPALFLDRIQVYFALHARHIGIYPTPEAVLCFAEELKPYKTSKGAVRFPLDQAVPFHLIQKIVRHRIEMNRGVTAAG